MPHSVPRVIGSTGMRRSHFNFLPVASLAAVLFDAIAPGPVTLTLSGSATGAGGTAMGLRFNPVTVTVQ